jgi:hypothetical protein
VASGPVSRPARRGRVETRTETIPANSAGGRTTSIGGGDSGIRSLMKSWRSSFLRRAGISTCGKRSARPMRPDGSTT